MSIMSMLAEEEEEDRPDRETPEGPGVDIPDDDDDDDAIHRFDRDFASPADYDEGFIVSDAVRGYQRTPPASKFDFSQRARDTGPATGPEASQESLKKALRLPAPEQWSREAAAQTRVSRGYTRAQTLAMELDADCSPIEKDDDGMEF